jgi:hypothetical protein
MMKFADTLRVVNQMKQEGVISDYAIAGAMALLFWIEPIPTFDLDVLVFLPVESGPIVSLDPIYRWAERSGYPAKQEHVVIAGVPVQFMPAHNALADEAIEHAATLEYDGVPVRVVRPEYLACLFLEGSAATRKRRERAMALLEAPATDRQLLHDLAQRFNIAL